MLRRAGKRQPYAERALSNQDEQSWPPQLPSSLTRGRPCRRAGVQHELTTELSRWASRLLEDAWRNELKQQLDVSFFAFLKARRRRSPDCALHSSSSFSRLFL